MNKMKMFVLTLPLIFALSVGLNTAHEYAHYAVCEAYGHDCKINVSILGTSSTSCIGCILASERFVISAVGGGIGAAVGLAIIAITNKPWIRVPAVALTASQGTMFFLETFAHDWYISTAEAGQVVGAVFLLTYVVLTFRWIFKIRLDELRSTKIDTTTA